MHIYYRDKYYIIYLIYFCSDKQVPKPIGIQVKNTECTIIAKRETVCTYYVGVASC